MKRRTTSNALGDSCMLTVWIAEVSEGGWGSLNMSWKTGDVKDSKSLWTRKSRLSAP